MDMHGTRGAGEGPLDPEGRAALLKRGWGLLAERDYRALAELLEPLPEEELVREPELGFLLSAAHHRQRNPQRALELLRAVRNRSGPVAGSRLEIECANLEGVCHLLLGQLDAALPYLQRTLELASEKRDQQYVSHACVNLGVCADIRGQQAEAISYYSRVIAAQAHLGDRRICGGAHHGLAMSYRQLGMLEESFTHFDHAHRILSALGSSDELFAVEVESALLHLQRGDIRLAEATLRRPASRVVSLGNLWEKAELLKVTGMLAMAREEWVTGHRKLSESLQVSRSTSNPLLEAEVLEELAVLAQAQGEEAEMERLIGESAAIYERIGTPARAQRARARVAPAGIQASEPFADRGESPP